MISGEWVLQQMRPAIRAFHSGKWPERKKKGSPPKDEQTLYREWKQRNSQK